jgi:hypothetical protein
MPKPIIDRITLLNCDSIEIVPDPENGCLDIKCQSKNAKPHEQPFMLLIFGSADQVPEIKIGETVND